MSLLPGPTHRPRTFEKHKDGTVVPQGLGDLQGRIVEDIGDPKSVVETIFQREKFKDAAKNLVLPAFMIEDAKEWRLVHYEADILSRVPWGQVDVQPLFDLPLSADDRKDVEFRTGLDTGILENSPEVRARALEGVASAELDYAFAASHLLDVLPNPWRGAELVRKVFDALLGKHDRSRVTDNFVFVMEEIRKRLERERDRLAQSVFDELLEGGTMRFMVVTEDLGFNRLPPADKRQQNQRKATRMDGDQFVLSLFEFVAEDSMNELENKVATYLDNQERLFFWYRNRPRRDYYVQGWKPHRIFADFVFTLKPDEPGAGDAFHKIFVTETKGLHLKESGDTEYKRTVFEVCNNHAKAKEWSQFVPAMKNKVVRFEVVDEDEWEKRLNAILQSS